MLSTAHGASLFIQIPELGAEAQSILELSRRNLRMAHETYEGWYKLYKTLALGTIPVSDQCAEVPQSQQALANIPFTKVQRKDSLMGIFFQSIKNVGLVCKARQGDSVCAVESKIFSPKA
ncbi:hypothetical protein BX616_000971 [Lobosporangium transversale]|nr:hypothetical protein BX616_000971 [Lobosporangium transversale]